MDNRTNILGVPIQKLKIIKNSYIFLSVIAIVFFAINQSLLIDKEVTHVPFNPNIFTSVEIVVRNGEKNQNHGVYYNWKLNDSVKVNYEVVNTLSNNKRISRVLWRVKYEEMTSENLLKMLKAYGLFLEDQENKLNGYVLRGDKIIFWNQNIKQYLFGQYDQNGQFFELTYYFPGIYNSSNKKDSFLNTMKEKFIGLPF